MRKRKIGIVAVVLYLPVALLLGCQNNPKIQFEPLSIEHNNAAPSARSAARVALQQLGIGYRWGGTSPSGFDCSGLVQYAYARAGITVPRTALQQQQYTRPVSPHELRTGDLVFFNTRGNSISHVGIYLSGSHFVHAPMQGRWVSVDSLNNPYWQERLVSVGRISHLHPISAKWSTGFTSQDPSI